MKTIARVVGRGRLPVAGAAVGAGLSMLSLWWVVPTAVAAFRTGRGRGRTEAAVVVFVGVVSAGIVAAAVVPSLLGLGSRFVGVVVCAVMVPWFAGRFRRQYEELVRAGWERAEQAERERWLTAERARLRERARIARDMHDVLGHDLSLIALSAGALKLAPGLEERHRRTAQDIRARAAVAVDRLGEVIGVLREEAEESAAGIARLVDEASAAGLAVELRAEGADAGLPPPVERAAYRVVQEALTNAAKHAPGAAVTVRVAYGEEETAVRVENAAAAGATEMRARGGGHGLDGLAERVTLAGGSFGYGPRDGGFVVEARLPHSPPEQTAKCVPQEQRRARHRVRRVVVAAVLVPLVTGAVLSAALMGWDRVTASRAVLDPGDFARLRVGQDRSEVDRVLPGRQLAHHPSAAEPEGRGIRCEYYAMTADRFDDRSGDAYRLCFRGGVLVTRDALTP